MYQDLGEINMSIKIDDTFKRTATFTVTHFNEDTAMVTGINDLGAEVIMTLAQLNKIYTSTIKGD